MAVVPGWLPPLRRDAWSTGCVCHDIPRAGAAAMVLAAAVLLPAAYLATGAGRVLLLMAGMALVDAGLQLALVANQARVQALLPAARSRLAALLTVCGAAGGALGAGAGYALWRHAGWAPAIGLAAAAGAVGLACSLLRAERRRQPAAARARLSEAAIRSARMTSSSPMLVRDGSRTA